MKISCTLMHYESLIHRAILVGYWVSHDSRVHAEVDCSLAEVRKDSAPDAMTLFSLFLK